MGQETLPQVVTLTSSKGKERRVQVLVPDKTPIGRGTRADVFRVLVTDDTKDKTQSPARYMAMKVYKDGMPPREHAKNTMNGHDILSMNLPASEKHRLIDVSIDEDGRVFMPLLNTDAWVVGMGQNNSPDRDDLQKNKLESIPNFNSILIELMDAVEKLGRNGVPVGPDVYFLTVNRETRSLDYAYADKEAMKVERTQTPEQVTLLNLYWAAGALNHFLHECVQEPGMYLARVRQEAHSRMSEYEDMIDDRTMSQDMEKFEWPSLGWTQVVKSNASWVKDALWRYIRGSWGS